MVKKGALTVDAVAPLATTEVAEPAEPVTGFLDQRVSVSIPAFHRRSKGSDALIIKDGSFAFGFGPKCPGGSIA